MVLFHLFTINKLQFIIIKPLQFLGKISFVLYLNHQLFGQVITNLLQKYCNLSYPISVIFIALPTVILFATFVTYRVEIPITRYIKTKMM